MNPPKPMVSLDEALAIVCDAVVPLGPESVPLDQALGRTLAADITSDMDMPPFDKSAMDGFAFNSLDAAETRAITAVIQAGMPPGPPLGPGECVRIMTGAAVPAGADRVVRLEHAAAAGGRMRIVTAEHAANICPRGEDCHAGDAVLARGTPVTPAVTGLLAAVGCAGVPVVRRARVAVIATGSEIVEPDQRPGPGRIRNSNAWQLAAQAAQCGAAPRYLGIAPDTPEAIGALFDRAREGADVILLSGGVSMGDFDLVPGVLAAHGVDIRFTGLAVQPGRPTLFGRTDGAAVFGLPGNPVSTLVIFELLVKPLLYRLMGRTCTPSVIAGELTGPVRVKPSDRQRFLPVCVGPDGRITPVTYHGAAHLAAYTAANALLAVPAAGRDLQAGERVHVRPL